MHVTYRTYMFELKQVYDQQAFFIRGVMSHAIVMATCTLLFIEPKRQQNNEFVSVLPASAILWQYNHVSWCNHRYIRGTKTLKNPFPDISKTPAKNIHIQL